MSDATNRINALILKEVTTLEDIRSINEAIQYKLKQINSQIKYSFRPLDVCTFKTKDGRTVTATVTKIAQKNVKLIEKNGMRTINWTVAPSLLKKVS